MSGSEDVDRFYDLLFELSNDIRHTILLLLMENPERMTQIAKVLDLTSPEVSRHLTRLSDNKLIEKDADNYYRVTNFGEYLLNSLVDLEFITKNREYFLKHRAVNIPIKFQKRLSEISGYRFEDNFMEFLGFINEKIGEARDFVWLYIDQYPLFAKNSINDSLNRGVRFKVIETGEVMEASRVFDLKHMVSRNGDPPNLELRKMKRKDIYLFISDQGSAISFPTMEGFDYTGFVGEDEGGWVRELFDFYWNPADLSLPQCTLCLSPIRGESIIETISGKELVFDTVQCVQTYKKLKQIYGERFS